ncbi:DNA-3-methyladenine glycosidase I [Actinobacillus equuli]|nr:DNA-3-methyladenine glycosidase I [Actinobacillus equuli]
MVTRCGWVGESEIYINYHDQEWGKPEFDSRKLFEKFV